MPGNRTDLLQEPRADHVPRLAKQLCDTGTKRWVGRALSGAHAVQVAAVQELVLVGDVVQDVAAA